MLPREAYVDPAVFEWEQQPHLLRVDLRRPCRRPRPRSAPRRRSAPAPNAILLVRGDDGVVRAFANTCRHRGHELLACNAVEPSGRAIVCPYHSWSYRLDGTLRNAPGFKDVDGFDTDEFGLAELRLVDWHGWLFVDPSGEDAEFAEHVAGLEDVVAPYRPEDLTVVDRHSYELATNWKVIAENYQECYHCSTIHPELSRISPPTSGENLDLEGSWMGGWMSIIEGAETMSLTGHSGGVAIKGLSEHELRTRDVPGRLSQPAGQPAPRLRDDPPHDAAGRRPHPRRVRVGVPEGGRRARRTSTRPTRWTSGT